MDGSRGYVLSEINQRKANTLWCLLYVKSEKKTKQQSLFDDVDDDEALPFWDPNLYDYITPGEYEDIYGRKYDGEYDNYYTNLKRKAGKKSNGKNKRR